MKLLLLHPLPFDGSIFTDGLRGLNDVCLAPTLYGAGDDIIAWARAALEKVGDDPVVVVGNSIGGSCGIEIARLAPEQVKALVLCGTKPGHRPEPALRDEALQLLSREDGLRAAWHRYWLPLFSPSADPAVVERGRLTALERGPDAIAAGVRAFHGRPDGEAFLASWPGPVWLVDGEHDLAAWGGRTRTMRAPGAGVRMVPGAGHYVPLEAPEALAAITSEALAAATR